MPTVRIDTKNVLLRAILFIVGISYPVFLAAQEPVINWEVANRFGPFEAYRDIDIAASPSMVFQAWRFKPGEDHDAWHKRVWTEREALFGSQVFRSPYAELIQASNDGDRTTALWDPVRDLHKERIASLARGDGSVRIKATSSLSEQQCVWQLEGHEPKPGSCDNYVVDVPLEGPPVGLTVTSEDGSRSVSVTIEVDHILIVGLGESYASGQGNPDIPAGWKSWSRGTSPKDLDVSWLNAPGRYLRSEAQWLDAECYRSFFNYQTLTALKIASEKPHSFVSFLHYACSGAEIFDGLVNPQGIPAESNRDTQFDQINSDSWFQARSQLNSVIMDLCAEPGELAPYPESIQNRLAKKSGLRKRHSFQRHNSFVGKLQPDPNVSPSTQGDARGYEDHHNSPKWTAIFGNTLPSDGLPGCPTGVAKPDLVFLGMGGNDSGFESIVRFYVAPSDFKTGLFASFASGQICPRKANLGSNSAAMRACKLKAFSRYDTEDLIEGNWSRKCADKQCRPLAERLILAFDAIMDVTGVSADQIITPVYPDPFRSDDLPAVDYDAPLPNYAGNRLTGNTPVLSQGADGGTDKIHNPLSRWLGGTVLIPGGSALAKIRRFDVTRQEAEVMLREVESIRSQQRRAAAQSGVSLVYTTRDAFLSSPWTFGKKGHLPNASRSAAWDPATWEPYEYEQSARAVRTFNDSLLTQQDLDEHVDFRGTAHPNLTGHRLLADRILPCAMQILDHQGNSACLGARQSGFVAD